MPEPAAAAPPPPGRRVAWAALALAALVLAWGAALAGLLWLDLPEREREAWQALWRPRAGLLFLFVLALPLLLWAAVRPWMSAWPRAARRLAEAASVAASANAQHRIEPPLGPPEMRHLAHAIDRLAQAHAALRSDVDARVAAARAALAAETQRLAALMAELTLAVLVCNRDGRVLLYNSRATALLGAGGALGLGRAVSPLLDAGALEHAWQQVLRRHEQGAERHAAHFVTALREGAAAGTLLRVQMVPTLDDTGAPGGYLLLLEDVSRLAHEDARRTLLIRNLTEGLRSAVGNLRAAAQALHQYPAMDAGRRAGLSAVVHEEAERIARQLREALGEAQAVAGGAGAAWSAEDVPAGDLAWALQRTLRSGAAPLECAFDGGGAERWLHVDGHAVVQVLAELARRLRDELGAREFAVEVGGEAPAPRLDLRWHGLPLQPGTLGAWEQEAAPVSRPALPEGLRAWLDGHGAELWSAAAERPQDRHRLCLQFGSAPQPAQASEGRVPAALRHRPIAYDFDLFHQAGQSTRLDETPLATLRLSAFDTETTGLRPSEGDEIISLGAVRIVNGRLLEHESFDRRVRPRRAVRASAQAVHGISTASLAGEPPLEDVLPAFARFCEDSVLLAHNAAFDMRFLELARERTGVRFDQPVLDTLLLSAVALPGLGADEHHLEQIAQRLGVPGAGRHQALGDALITARVFLQLLPLLAARGIGTLGQAREASRGVAQAHETF